MKRFSPEEKLRWMKISRLRERKRVSRLFRKLVGGSRRHASRMGQFTVVAPVVFSLDENFDGVAECINSIQKIGFGIRVKGVRKVVDFSPIKSLEPAAALVLAAEIDRWRRLYGFRPAPHKIGEWDHEVLLQFFELGLFDLLFDTNTKINDSPNVRWIPFQFGRGDAGEPADGFLTRLTEIAGEIPERTIFYDALAEALLNVNNHAYISTNMQDYSCKPIEKGWWIAGSFDTIRNEMTGMVFDQGLSIPKTLPRSGFWEKIQELASNDDAKMIEAAFQLSRTRTSLSHRGQGLGQILSVIDEVGSGMLRVISGYGEIRYDSNGLTNITHNSKLGGTLIEWRIPVPKPTSTS